MKKKKGEMENYLQPQPIFISFSSSTVNPLLNCTPFLSWPFNIIFFNHFLFQNFHLFLSVFTPTHLHHNHKFLLYHGSIKKTKTKEIAKCKNNINNVNYEETFCNHPVR